MKIIVIFNIAFYLIISPILFASDLPKRIELTFINSGEQYVIEKFHSDYIMYNVLNPEKRVIIQKEFTKDITTEEIS